ncbi:MAG TPA: oligosaccharide flippase family protein, partial [Chloroflexota bacterium]|nr:oligosaccharide flippase family protein [Chloroflexota bacterium]
MSALDSVARTAVPRKGRLSINVAANLGHLVLTTATGIFLVPFLVRHLGVAAYGLIPLTLNVAFYLRVFTAALNVTVGRFLTIALERSDDLEANRVFNTALIGNLALAAVLLGPSWLMVNHAEQLFNVPSGYETEARLLFACAIGMFMLTTISNSFHVSSYCRNRFDLRNLVFIAGLLGYVGVIIALFKLFEPSIWQVGVAGLAQGTLVLLGAVVTWRWLTPTLHVRPRCFASHILKQLTAMGGWVVVSQVGVILFLSVEVLIVNRMFGAEAGGQYAVALQWSMLLRSIAGAIAGVFAPTVLALYAHADIGGLVRYIRRAVRLTGLAMVLPVGLVCGFSKPLLTVWLGEEFASLALLMSLLTIHLSVNLGFLPVHSVP